MTTERPRMQQIERAVQEEIIARVERRHHHRPTITPEQTLEALGLDSLDVHELVDSLETKLGSNPFEDTYSVNDLRTVGDLYRVYQAGFRDDSLSDSDADEALLAARRRAAARRRGTT